MASGKVDSANDATILSKTGKARQEWYEILDAYDAKAKGHRSSASHLQNRYGLDAWYAQSLTVDYERDRGLREVGQRSDGKFAFSVSRTIKAARSVVWEAWASADKISVWFTSDAHQDFREGGSYGNADGDVGTFKRIQPISRIRFTWDNPKHSPGTIVTLEFYEVDTERTKLTLTHAGLKDAECMNGMKQGWTWALTSLKSYLEEGRPIPYEVWEKENAMNG